MADTRISAHAGQVVNLDADFFHNGVLADPYAIRRVDIYKTSVLPANLVATIYVAELGQTEYPSPLVSESVGRYVLPFHLPTDFQVPDTYIDVWTYYQFNPCPDSTADCNLDDPEIMTHLKSCCHRFWAYPDGWACLDKLYVINFGFEALSIHFNQPEIRPLQVGLMPLPLYDFDYNAVMPLIPNLKATISVETRHGELLVDADPMTIGLRQGSFRTNPFELKWMLNTSHFLIGTYRYRVTINLPDGSSRTSNWFMFTVN